MQPGRKLRITRLLQDLTQSEAAEIIGCSSAYLCQIETGVRVPGRVLAFKIQDATEKWGDKIPVVDWWV